MSKKSAGMLLFRETAGYPEVLLVHPGGPFWSKKDEGAWSIPKGEFEEGEDPLDAARREFEEEMGSPVQGEVIPLDQLKQPSGKIIYAWAVRGDFNPDLLKSNTFPLEWPPKSGRMQEFPEVDRAGWFTIETGKQKILKGQAGFLEQLQEILGKHSAQPGEVHTAVKVAPSAPLQGSLFDTSPTTPSDRKGS